jgi:hypothetical protein
MEISENIEISFQQFVTPVLNKLGFSRVLLRDCMHPEHLFQSDRIWFSVSWDWRDQYLDVCLGRLFWFRDVMPRVVIIGDYSHWNRTVTWNSIRKHSDCSQVFHEIGNSLPDALARFEAEYADVFAKFIESRDSRVPIADYVGKEVHVSDLKKFLA